MLNKRVFEPDQLRYLQLLSQQYPTVQAASTEIIRLQSILNLPKGTEHFMSDIHGEYDAFLHILNSCSGEVKQKLNEVFGDSMSLRDKNELATLIYYPRAKLELVTPQQENLEEWYRTTIHQLVQVCRYVSIKHTRNILLHHFITCCNQTFESHGCRVLYRIFVYKQPLVYIGCLV